MNKTLPITRPLKVGEHVLSNKLKLTREVTEVTATTVTLKAIHLTDFKNLFNAISTGFNKTMTLDQLEIDYTLVVKDPILAEPTLTFTRKEFNDVFVRCGEVYQDNDTSERVIVDTVAKSGIDGIDFYVNAVSCDRIVGKSFLRYQLTSDYFKSQFTCLTKPLALKGNLSTSV